jgi:pimeloyl-ACP methyl ester carboxylesterase
MHLLLLHGAIGAAEQMKKIAAELKTDFTVHTMDFPGHGGKPFPAGSFSIPLFAEDVLAYIDQLQLENVAIFGYSMGGYIGMYLALHHPKRVSRLATLATKFQWDPAIAQREIQMINPAKIEEKVPAFARTLEQRHQPSDWKIVLERTAGLMVGLGDNPPLSPDNYRIIAIPTLLMLGDSDKMVSLDETLTVFKNIPAAQLAVLPATHHPIEQVDVSLLTAQLRRFFRS